MSSIKLDLYFGNVHAGSSLSGPFVESFDKLSSNSQQALQQLVTQGSKLIPEGSSIRDSFDKLSFNSQQALYHLANSGLSLPSLLPQKHKQASLDDTMAAGTLDSKAAEAMLAQLRSDLQSAERENAMVSDLLQRSQQDLSLSQAHTHELLASVARIEDDRTLLASQKAYLEAALEKVPEGKEYVEQCPQCPTCDDAPQCPTCDDAESLYGNFGSQVQSLVFCKWLQHYLLANLVLQALQSLSQLHICEPVYVICFIEQLNIVNVFRYCISTVLVEEVCTFCRAGCLEL